MNRRDFLRMALASPLLAACGKLIGDDKMATLEELMKPMIDGSVARGEMSAANAALLRDKFRYESGVANVTGGWVKPSSTIPSFEQFEFRNATLLSGGQLPHEGWRVIASSGTTVPGTGAETLLTFDTPTFDTTNSFDDYGFFDSATPTRITIPQGQDGYYIFGASFRFSIMPDGTHVQTFIKVNGTAYAATQQQTGASKAMWTDNLTLLHLNSGDYLELYGTQNSGGDETCTPTIWGFRWR